MELRVEVGDGFHSGELRADLGVGAMPGVGFDLERLEDKPPAGPRA